MRFVCDERDRGCVEGKKREKHGVLSNQRAKSRQRGSAVEESETRATCVRTCTGDEKGAEGGEGVEGSKSSSNPRRVYTPLAKFRRSSSRNDCLQQGKIPYTQLDIRQMSLLPQYCASESPWVSHGELFSDRNRETATAARINPIDGLYFVILFARGIHT